MRKLIVAVVLVTLCGCNRMNLDDTKTNACNAWKQDGYSCVGYEGYEYGVFGAKVWNTITRADTPGVVYSGYVQKWGDEYHIYGPRVVNAILTK